jgi:hypothetical protein
LEEPKSILKASSKTFQSARDQKKTEKLLDQAAKRLDREYNDDYDFETGTFGWERE